MSLLIGRERERRALRDRLSATRDGRGSLVLIGGEAGIGKTTLADDLCREASEQGALVLTGRCFDLTETPPYGPWLYLFARYRPTGPLPPLPALFAQPGVIGDAASRATLFNTVLDFLRALSAHIPLVVLLDDLHWADLASLDLLRFLAQSVVALPLLLIGTYRSDELTRRHPLYALLPTLVRESQAVRLDLRRLTDDDVRAVIAARYPLPDTETARLVAYVQERAEGNPLFLGELLRTLAEEGALHQGGDDWQLGDMTRVGIPMLLRQVIDGRVERLGEEAKGLLTVATVIGQEMPLTLWAMVAATDEETLLDVIEAAAAAHLLEATPDGTRARFAHALVREALYEGILPPRRRRLHRAVGEALAATRNPDPDAVAYHLQHAGDARAAEWLALAGARAQGMYADRTAVDRLEAALAMCDEHDLDARLRCRVAGFLAGSYRFIDHARAMHYLADALRLAGQLDDREYAACLLVLRAWLSHDVQQTPAGLTDIRAARAITDALVSEEGAPGASDPAFEKLGFAGGTAAEFLADLDGGLTEYLGISGDFTEARAVGERFVAGAPMGPDARMLRRRHQIALGNAYFGLYLSYIAQGEPDRATDAAAAALRYYGVAEWDMMCGNVLRQEVRGRLIYRTEQITERWRLVEQQDAFHARWLSTLSVTDPRLGQVPVLAVEGRWAEAREIASSLPRGLSHMTHALTHLTLGTLARAQGDVELARSVVRALLPDGPTAPVGLDFVLHTSALLLGAGLTLDTGDLTAAHAWLSAHEALLHQCEAVLGRSEGQALWAQFHWQSGDADAAYRHAERAHAHATEPRQPLALIAAHRLLGELDTAAGRHDAAAMHLNDALVLADACQAPYERALTLLALAELRAAIGATADAATPLDEARAIFTSLDAKPALARADALAARLSGMKDTQSAYPNGLSAREVEVLRLVAAGCLNTEIAERLFISVRTVEQHLRSIYNKIGNSSRTAATRFAIEHHLA